MELQEQITALQKNQADQAAAIESLSKENAKLKADLKKVASSGAVEAAQSEEPKIPEETFTVDSKKFKFNVAKFIHPKKGELTALEALTDEGLLSDLVASGSGLITEVKSAKK